MKKTLVAVAALTLVGSAFAQSTVTLYGKMDIELVSSRAETAAGVKTTSGAKVNNGLNGSRWGMKGSEDLGGGLNAIFQMESGVNNDIGTFGQGNLPFGRQIYVGVKGGFGQLTAGRQYAPYDNAFSSVDAQQSSNVSAMGSVFGGGIHTDGGGNFRVNNQITYFTPAMGGFNAQLSWAPGENGATGVSAGNYTGIGLGYGNGPINIQFGQESIRAIPGTTAATKAVGTTNAWILGGSYDFGPAKLYANYARAQNGAKTEDKGWHLGVSAPIGPASLWVGYARETTTLKGAADGDYNRGYGAVLNYPLSKRTKIYGEFESERKTLAFAVASSKASRFGVGLQHDF